MTKAERQKLWEDRITAYQKSGQSVREWCATQEGVSPRQLWYWLRKYKNRDGVTLGKANRWLPVEISDQAFIEEDHTLLVKIGPANIVAKPGVKHANSWGHKNRRPALPAGPFPRLLAGLLYRPAR